MGTVTLAEAKTHLSHLLDQVAAGEEVVITRRGHPVAKISPIVEGKRPVRSLAGFRRGMPARSEPSAALIRQIRNEDL